jgi:transposase
MSETVPAEVIVGVDTHKHLHVAVAIDALGARLGAMTIPVRAEGYRDRVARARALGTIRAFGVEGTGSYGAGLSRFLREQGHDVFEVNRPDRQLRRRRGKSDPLDAEAAARAVLGGQAAALPKCGTGALEMIRHLKAARDGALKARSQAMLTITLDGGLLPPRQVAAPRHLGADQRRPARAPPARHRPPGAAHGGDHRQPVRPHHRGRRPARLRRR